MRGGLGGRQSQKTSFRFLPTIPFSSDEISLTRTRARSARWRAEELPNCTSRTGNPAWLRVATKTSQKNGAIEARRKNPPQKNQEIAAYDNCPHPDKTWTRQERQREEGGNNKGGKKERERGVGGGNRERLEKKQTKKKKSEIQKYKPRKVLRDCSE